MLLPHPLVKLSIVGSLRDREAACLASCIQGLNFESCIWRAVPSHSPHHPQEVILAQFSLYVYKSGLKPNFFHFIFFSLRTRSVWTNVDLLICIHIEIWDEWNESGFRPPLCTYRLNWARRSSWGWWDDWDDTVLQTQDSKFEHWRSEAKHATSRSQRLPTILTFTRGCGRNIFYFFQNAETGNRTPSSGVKCSGANHHPRHRDMNCYRNSTICNLLLHLFYLKYTVLRWLIVFPLTSFLVSDAPFSL